MRKRELYIEADLLDALWTLARARTSRSEDHVTTADQMADFILRKAISEKWPQIFEHQNRIAKLEREVIGTIRDEDSNDQ